MAYEESLKNVTLLAGTGVGVYTGVPGMPGSANPNGGVQFHVVKWDSTAQQVVLGAAGDTKDVIVGVLQNKPQAVGEAATVAISGISMVVLGDTVAAANTAVKLENGGRVVTATLPTDAALVVGTVLAAGADGDLVPCLLKLQS